MSDLPPNPNPYATPSAPLEEPAMETTLPDASAGKRFLNYLFDQLFIVGLAFLAGVLAYWMHEQGIAYGPALFLDGMGRLEEYVFGGVLTFVYYTASESMGGRTIGKLITGTAAVMQDGSRLKVSSVPTRSLCRLIPFEPFSFLMKSGGWHDTMTSTKVVDLRARPTVNRSPVRHRTLPQAARAAPVDPGRSPRPAFRPPPAAPRPPLPAHNEPNS